VGWLESQKDSLAWSKVDSVAALADYSSILTHTYFILFYRTMPPTCLLLSLLKTLFPDLEYTAKIRLVGLNTDAKVLWLLSNGS
jgi:hypothetical protein